MTNKKDYIHKLAFEKLQFQEIRSKKGILKSITLVLRREQLIWMYNLYPTHKVISFNFYKRKNNELKIIG